MEPRKGIHLVRRVVERVAARHEVAFVFAGEDKFGHLEGEILPALRSRVEQLVPAFQRRVLHHLEIVLELIEGGKSRDRRVNEVLP